MNILRSLIYGLTKRNITAAFIFFSSLTLEGVRRQLEKDMNLVTYSLDAHKKFIKQSVDKVGWTLM